MKTDRKYSIAVDFDGVINSYTSGWTKEDDIPDPPVAGAFEWLAEMSKSFSVIIHSARLTPRRGVHALPRASMYNWFLEHGMSKEVLHELTFWTSEGKPTALIYIDDRGYRFTGKNFPTKDEIHKLKSWVRS